MNFFDDDFGLGDSPLKYSAKPPVPKKPASTTKSIKPAGGDDFDDLLDELLVKETKKNAKKKIQNTSQAFTEKHHSPPRPPLHNTTQWDMPDSFTSKNQMPDLGKTYEPPPMRNRPSSRSIYDGSQDNKSVRSGRSGATAQPNFGGGFLDNLNTMKPSEQNIQFPASSTRMMKPPLRKRQSREGSVAGQSMSRAPEASLNSFQETQNVKIFPPPAPIIDTKPQINIKPVSPALDLSASEQVKQKIVYVKEDNAKIKEQHEKELKLIKQSHERQVQFLKGELNKETEVAKNLKLKLLGQFEQQRSKDKRLLEDLARKDLQKTKDMYEWEIKKKTQSYELQIEKLKKLADMAFINQSKSQSPSKNLQLEREELKIKEKELEYKVKKSEDLQRLIRDKERALENKQFDFDNYRRREEEKLQQERKSLYNLQAELQKRKTEIRKHTEQQKLNLVNDLAKQELEISRQKQRLKIERQELDLEKQLFEKQKIDYEEFNGNIIKDYKVKLRELEIQRQEYQQKEIQLYKKIHTVELMANAKGLKMNATTKPQKSKGSPQHREKGKQRGENDQNIPNKRGESQPHQQERNPHSFLQQHARQSSHSYVMESNTNLKEYLLKLNKENKRMRPSFV